MNILQISAPKTGSYWLNTILKNILHKKNIPTSTFIEEQPVYNKLKDKDLSFKEQAEIDMIDIQDDGFYYRISSLFKESIPDLQQYAATSSLAWTHSTWCQNSAKAFDLFDKKVCVIRDPRDRALSSAKFAFTPYMQQHYPTSYATPREYLAGEFENLMEQWVWFYGNYLLHKDRLDIHFIFYENLLHNFDQELESLLKYLDLSLSKTERAEIAEAVSFKNMKQDSPKHLQKGRSQKWVSDLNLAQQEIAVEKAGPLMRLLNYPLSSNEEEGLPKIPKTLPKEELRQLLGEINWSTLY